MRNRFIWQGRVDSEETGNNTRWHQHVRPFDDLSQGGVALIGFAVDEGVRRNGGRPGAAEGPHALRGALANLPVLNEPALWDAGDVYCEGGALEAAQAALGTRVAQAMRRGCLPLVLGGGHEMAWGTYQGITLARPEDRRVLIINFDAHFDLRQATQANSGTPFRQIHDWCVDQGRPFDYRVLGISRFANTRVLFERAEAWGVRYWLDDDLQTDDGVEQARQALSHDLVRCDAIYLTICLDVLPGAQAPGVSAPATLGVPLARVLALMDTVLSTGKLVAADIAELNPGLDRDGLTVRAAARIAAHIARNAVHDKRQK
jgi:formiminoglutamase